MRVRKIMYASNPLHRWRWDAAGEFGYCASKKAALRCARRAIRDDPR